MSRTDVRRRQPVAAAAPEAGRTLVVATMVDVRPGFPGRARRRRGFARPAHASGPRLRGPVRETRCGRSPPGWPVRGPTRGRGRAGSSPATTSATRSVAGDGAPDAGFGLTVSAPLSHVPRGSLVPPRFLTSQHVVATLPPPPHVVVAASREDLLMRCPWCAHPDDRVVDSRAAEGGGLHPPAPRVPALPPPVHHLRAGRGDEPARRQARRRQGAVRPREGRLRRRQGHQEPARHRRTGRSSSPPRSRRSCAARAP